MHTLFHCEFAKRAWLVSAVPFRTEGIIGGFKELMEAMFERLSEPEICDFVSMLWAVWRMRNEVVYGEKRQSIEACQAFYKRERDSCQVRILISGMSPTRQTAVGMVVTRSEGQINNSYSCFVDGSWTPGGLAGIGVYLLYEGRVIQWLSKAIHAVNPAQAEAIAVLEGYQLLVQKAKGEGQLFSNSKEVVSALATNPPEINDWRSYNEIWKAWVIQRQHLPKIVAIHCGREHPKLGIAHRLAKQGRLYGWEKGGTTEPIFNLEEML